MSGKIHRLKKESDFVTLDNHALRNKELSWKGKGLHCYLMHLPEDWQINIADLQNRSDDGRDSTAAGLKELINTGYVTRTRVVDDKTKQFIGYDYNVYERPEYAIAENGKPVNGFSVNGEAENGKPVTNKNRYKVILNEESIKEEITPLSENGKTAITLHSPDQIEDTFLHVVEQVSLEADFETGKTSSAGPGEKETPALQNAGHFEASVPPNPPPTFFNPDIQRRYEKGTPPEKTGKPRKTQAEDRAAEICAELKTEKDVDFFHAIHAAWGEWIDYKRREKKGTYKTAKTEAATITALARAVNYDAAAGRSAIEHSIAHTYQGIYPPKDGAPAKQAAERYSLDDCPVAQTPGELRDELSRFYVAHKSERLLDEVQHLAETNYGPERLRSIVTDFCGNRVAKGRHGDTFGQHHAELGLWLKRQKGFDAKNETHQHAGPQSQPQLRSAAPVNYSID